MNLAELFIRRPVTTTLIILGILVFGGWRTAAAGERPADRRLPHHPGQRQPARRQPRDDGLVGGAAAREAVRDHRRRRLDQLDQLPGQHQHHAAVRSEPQHRRRGAGRPGDDRQGGAAAAAADAGAAVVPEGQSRRSAGLFLVAALADAAAVDASTSTPRRPSRSASRWSAASRRCRSSARTKYAVRVDVDPRQLAARGIGIDEVATAIQNANVNLPTGTLYGPQQTFTVQANGQLLRADGLRGRSIVAYRNGNPGAPRRGRARLRRRRERQDAPPGIKRRAHASTWPIQKQPGTNTVAVVDAVKTLLPTFREQLPAALSARRRAPIDRASIRESVHDVKFTLLLTVVPRRAGHLPLPAEHVGDDHPEPRAAGLDRRHVRGHVPARLQPRQPVADGADAVRSASSSTTRS